jgi:ActR/RegA family two-component response regulator
MMSNKISPQPQILVVDDQDNWREVLTEILSVDYSVTSASGFSEAESLLETKDFHVVILDIRLVDADSTNEQGMARLEKLRNDKGAYDIEVVMVTGYPTPDTATQSLVDLQAANYFQKGNFNFMEFERVVREAAERAMSRKAERSLERYGILVIEDDSAWSEALADILRRDGYRVDIVPDSQSAVEQLREDIFRLAIVDLKLGPTDSPDVEGMKLLKYINSQLPRIEVIVVTGVPSVQRVIDAFKHYNVYHFFSKCEFSVEAFRRAVEEVFTVILERYAVAWLEGWSPKEPLKVGQEYHLVVTVQNGRSLKYASAPFLIVPSGRTERLRVVLFAEDMDTQPSRSQTLELPEAQRPRPVPFRLVPRRPGRKVISLDMYQGDRWLVNLELGALQVVSQEEVLLYHE